MKCLVLVVLIAMACGPSSAEIKTAKTATYQTSRHEMFDIAVAAAVEDYKIMERDLESTTFATMPQWYNPEGGRESSGAGDTVQIVDRSVNLHFIVQIVELEDKTVAVSVEPKTFQHLSGSPKPRELKPDDPNLPSWVSGRAETLQLAIYNRAKQFARK
jgi:hypothetical protein